MTTLCGLSTLTGKIVGDGTLISRRRSLHYGSYSMIAPNQTPGPQATISLMGKSPSWEFTARRLEPAPQVPPAPPRAELDQGSVAISLPSPPKSWQELHPETRSLFSVKHRYLGQITSVHPDYFNVQLVDERTGEYADAEIPKDMVKPEEQDLLQEGADFVWIFGYEATSSLRHSDILYIPRFRQVTQENLTSERAKVDALMDSVFGSLDHGSTGSPTAG